MAQLDASQTGDQVAGSTPAGSAAFFHGDLVILFLPLVEKGLLSVPGKKMCTILVNCLEDSLPSKSVVR